MFLRAILVLILLTLAGGAAFLLVWDIPAPTERKEIEIPHDRLPK
jgi:hypothetical protein